MKHLAFAAIIALSGCGPSSPPNENAKDSPSSNETQGLVSNQQTVNAVDTGSNTPRLREICFIIDDVGQHSEAEYRQVLDTLARLEPNAGGVRLRLHRSANSDRWTYQRRFFEPCDPGDGARADIARVVIRGPDPDRQIEREVNVRTGAQSPL